MINQCIGRMSALTWRNVEPSRAEMLHGDLLNIAGSSPIFRTLTWLDYLRRYSASITVSLAWHFFLKLHMILFPLEQGFYFFIHYLHIYDNIIIFLS